jgi:hypothetical protein
MRGAISGLTLLGALLAISGASAQTAPPGPAQGPGEMIGAASNYPDPRCSRPDVKLIKPGYVGNNIDDNGPVSSYNKKVSLYNRQAQDYDVCMHAYIDNANAELKRVQTDANARIRLITDMANSRLKLIEAKVAAAIHDANQVAQDEGLKHQ